MQNKQIKSNGVRLSKIAIFLTIPCQFIIASFLCCLLIFYRPFTTVQKYIVDTAMNTYSHQFIARIFLSDTAIKQITGSSSTAKTDKQQMLGVKVQNIDNTNIEQYEIKGTQYHGYMLVISDPTRIKVGYTKKLLTVGETTSVIAKDYSAVAAINGGGFSGGASWVGTGAVPTDFVISGGTIVYKQSNLLNGGNCNVIALNSQGKLIVGSHSINDLESLGVTDAVTLPGCQPLVVNGHGTYKGDGGAGMNPRTAIGQRQDGSIMMLVLDGRQINMLGATLLDVQKIMLSKGAYTAAVLDGGSSTTMYYNGEIINNPCSSFGERTVATAFYVTR